MKAVLSIAGSDSSGGAGIQADIKAIAAHRLFAETAITAITAQNTLGVAGARNVVADPVMVATSGARLIDEDAVAALRARLLPLADVVTPNIPEAEVLCGFPIADEAAMERAARQLLGMCGGAALVKGGHGANDANDVLALPDGTVRWFRAPAIDTGNTHGTGCTLSSAIACGLAAGKDMAEAVAGAKAYVTGALAAGLNLGRGSGPLDHMWAWGGR